MSLCECGCGGEASPGMRFISGHNSRMYSYNKGKKLSKESKEKIKQKEKETRRLNKLLKEGKIELPFCACGCGGRVRKIGNKYIRGHQRRGKPSWIKGLTKETNETVKKLGEKVSKSRKEFFQTEEGQKWLDDNDRGKNNPMYGKEAWSKGLTKEKDERLRVAGEKISRLRIIFFKTEKGLKVKQSISECLSGRNLSENHKNNIRDGLNIFYQSEEGIKLKKKSKGRRHTKEAKQKMSDARLGEKNHMYGKHLTEEAKQKLREAVIINHKKGVYNRKPTQPEKGIDSIVQNLIPNEYKYNGNYDLGITIGGKIPDFVNVNGKKKAIDLFGDYWHDGEDPQVRIDLFKKYGWDLLVIWEHELKNRDAVIQKILKFHGIESDYVIPQRTLDKWVDSKDKKRKEEEER